MAYSKNPLNKPFDNAIGNRQNSPFSLVLKVCFCVTIGCDTSKFFQLPGLCAGGT